MTQKNKKGILRIGTSNIVLPGNKKSFPPPFHNKSRLNYYSTLFNTVEINSSFYKVPLPSTFEKWALDVNVGFQFTVKLWKEVTHAKELHFDKNSIIHFLNAAESLGNKKGCLLLQFPGKITIKYFKQVEKILHHIGRHPYSNHWKKSVEFRSPTWYESETNELLDEYGASLVIHDMPKSKNMDINKKAEFIYIRFHGIAGDYRGSYTTDFLNGQCKKIKWWLDEGKDVYVYFNNTIGNAFENAMTLKAISRSFFISV